MEQYGCTHRKNAAKGDYEDKIQVLPLQDGLSDWCAWSDSTSFQCSRIFKVENIKNEDEVKFSEKKSKK